MTILILAFIALTALALWLDHRGLDVGHLFGSTDPRELVDRAHRYGEGGER